MFLEFKNQESVNSPKNLALKKSDGTFIEPFAVFDPNYCGNLTNFQLIHDLQCLMSIMIMMMGFGMVIFWPKIMREVKSLLTIIDHMLDFNIEIAN